MGPGGGVRRKPLDFATSVCILRVLNPNGIKEDPMAKDERRDIFKWKKRKAQHGRKPTQGRRKGKDWKHTSSGK